MGKVWIIGAIVFVAVSIMILLFKGRKNKAEPENWDEWIA